MSETDWRDEALCTTSDPEAWFPDQSTYTYENKIAKKLCSECPVRIQCHEYAMSFPFPVAGIWGGIGERERGRIKTSLKRAA
jgi:WhiB family redox-sensing transcriptional regulator